MPKWRVTAEFQPRSSPSRFGNRVHKEGDPNPYTVHAGDRIDGINEGEWIKTHIDGVSPDEVYIQILDHAELDVPLSPEPIRSDERDAFCALVTTMARHYETDRDYLMAWAFLGTNNLQELGQPGDGKIGPFQFSAEEWDTAIKGPGKDLNLLAEQRSGWRDQVPVAALVLKDCIQRLQSGSATNELPTRLEVYFAQKFGPGAEEVLKQPRTDRCRDRIKNAPAAGTYAAELANSDKTIQQTLDDLRAPLESAFKAAYTLIETQPPEIRFFDESDLPPGLKVALGTVDKTDLLEETALAEDGWAKVKVVTSGALEHEDFVRSILLTEVEGTKPPKVDPREMPMSDIKLVDLEAKVTDIGPIHLLRAEWKNPKSRFVLIRYSIGGKEEPFGLRLDLDKKAILDDVGDDETSRAVKARAREIWNVVVAAR
jgi:hypothetical protein